MQARRSNVDQGYAWVVLAAAFSIQFVAGILTYSPGVINIAVLEQIDDDLTKTSVIGSTLFGTFHLMGPAAGLIQKRIGPRLTAIAGGLISLAGMIGASFCRSANTLIMTHGFITGFGICLGGNVVGAVPGHYFDKMRSFAYGVCISGGAMGLLVAGPLARYLLVTYGLRGTLLMLGAIAFHLCAAGMAITRNDLKKNITINVKEENEPDVKQLLVQKETNNPEDEKQPPSSVMELGNISKEQDEEIYQTESKKEKGIKQYIESKCQTTNITAFLFYNLATLSAGLGDSACVFHLPNYCRLQGTSTEQTSNLFTIVGATGVFSRVMSGVIASSPSIGPVLVLVGLLGISGLWVAMFPLFSYSYSLQMLFSAMYGMYSQGQYPLNGPITIELVGLQHVAIGYGLVYFSSGIGYFLGPPIASLIYNLSGIYGYTYIFAGTCILCGSMLAAATAIFRRDTLDTTGDHSHSES